MAGLLVCFGVWFLDYVLRVDDPVGAVAVHMMNGIWGTIAVGLFANPAVPGYNIADANGNVMAGLVYGGGFKLLGIQLLGCGVQKGSGSKYRGAEIDATLLPKVKVEVIVSTIPVDKVIETAKKALYTGHIGDGKIFVYHVARVVKVRTGEEDFAALADVE